MLQVSKIYKSLIYTIATVFAVAIATACQKEEQMPQGGFPVNICTTIETANQLTKTSVNDDLSINWTNGDKLLMLAQTSDNAAASTVLDLQEEDAGAKRATFTGAVETPQVPAYCYFAYPANANTALDASAGTVTFNYASQDGSHNPFLASEAIAYSSSGIECTLAHIGGVLQIDVPAGVQSLEIRGNNNEKLSGYIYNFKTSSGSIDENATRQITVTLSGSGGTCYVNMPPVKFEKGFTIIFNGPDGKNMYKSFNYTSGGCDFSQVPASGESATAATLKGAMVNMEVSEFTEFQPGLTSSNVGSHIYSNSTLTGSQVKISSISLSGVPSSVITGYSATLTNSAGAVVRSYNSSTVPSELTLGSDNNSNWPYLPKGTYTLVQTISTIYGTTTNFEDKNVILPAPDAITATIDAMTSYSYYLAGDINGANSCDNATIYGISTSVKISSKILGNSNYSNLKPTLASFSLDGNTLGASAGTSNGDSYSFAYSSNNATGQSWAKHNLASSISFDGATATANKSVEITGLPYSFQFYNNEDGLDQSGWTRHNVDYTNKKCAIQYDGSNGYLISPQFNIPGSTKIAYGIQAQYYRAWAINVSGKSIYLRVGASSSNSAVAGSYNEHECKGNNNTGQSYGTCTGTLSMNSSAEFISLHHNNANVSAQIDYLCIYLLELKYN
ncbi:MAG: hypothetical protein IJB58_06075 [Bacteroidales bacterium]|nr:hypothetical protein [Bacteroidales bacterium]